ncbi:MAG TPA: hypothetical protein VG389_03035 [Myxococcota bacterium]|nr:hypothetical protein [Myxococcota bacterium]
MRTPLRAPAAALLATAALLAATPVWGGADSGDDAAGKKLEVVAVPLGKAVAPGAEARAQLVLTFKEDATHHWGAPLKITLSGTAPVAPTKPALTRADAVDPLADKDATRLEFAVPFKAAAKGSGTLSAAVSLFVCFEKDCVPVDRTVTWTVKSE